MSKPKQEMTVARKRAASRLTDRLLVGTGVALATASAFFPWYVFFNEDKFGLRIDPMEHTRDLPPLPGRQVFSVSPLAMTDRTKDETIPADPLDALTTATTVSSLGREERGAMPEEQPMPGRGDFRLLHVANGRALIEDGAGMYMVRIGSILPNNSKVATLEQRDGRWVIVTSGGEIYQEQMTARP